MIRTIPHKVDDLDSYDDDCKQVGAANTVEISNGKLADADIIQM